MPSSIYRLRFKAPVHFGEDNSGLERSLEYLHSDTLFSALCQGWAALYGGQTLETDLRLSALTANPESEPGFLVTSAYIFQADKFYLPKPLLSLTPTDRDRLENPNLNKAFKEVTFLEASAWSRWVNGGTVTSEVSALQDSIRQYQAAFNRSVVPRSFVPRRPADTSPYFCSVVTYNKEGGLFFAVRFQPAVQERLQDRLETVLDYLADAGLGGERSSGYGHFSWEKYALSLEEVLEPLTTAPEGYVTLSLVSPFATPAENQPPLADWRYSLLSRRGFAIRSDGREQGRRQNLLMLGEGAVYRRPQAPTGRLVDLTPPTNWTGHRVFRCGMAFSWPCKLNE